MGWNPIGAPSKRVLTAGACDPQLRTRGCADGPDGQANLIDNQARHWEAPETPKYGPGQNGLCWASISSIPQGLKPGLAIPLLVPQLPNP